MLISSEQADFTTTLEKALHEINPNYDVLSGVVITGTHKPTDIASKMNMIRRARENGTPFLGICFGMQLMAVEYMQNVVGLSDATSEEISEGSKVVIKMPEERVGLRPAMHHGAVYAESYWHNYKVDIDSFPALWDGFEITTANDVVGYMKLKTHPHFVGVQFHPEYQSSKEKPHPVLVDFLDACRHFTVG